MEGTVAWFSPGKGIGFITPKGGGPDVFVHFSGIDSSGFKTLSQSATVEYEIGISEKNGKPMAMKVRQIGEANGSDKTATR